jgi:hypothetical protein
MSSPFTAASYAPVLATPSTQPKFRLLSPEELTDKRKKGECYFCPEKFTLNHICPMK